MELLLIRLFGGSPVADIVISPGLAIFSPGPNIIAIRIVSPWQFILVRVIPRVHRNGIFFEKPTGWIVLTRGSNRGIRDERVQSLFGGRVPRTLDIVKLQSAFEVADLGLGRVDSGFFQVPNYL